MLRTVGWRTDACEKNIRSGRMMVEDLASLAIARALPAPRGSLSVMDIALTRALSLAFVGLDARL